MAVLGSEFKFLSIFVFFFIYNNRLQELELILLVLFNLALAFQLRELNALKSGTFSMAEYAFYI